MKKMKTSELRDFSQKELYEKASDLKKILFDLNIKLYKNQLDNIREIRKTKKDIARIYTIINEKKKK